ncbi:MAG: hypothetical protein EA390_06780 [Balneolaceae bacterium]|nr:MAG: hypothetical protein EA390_06780 [Balneolaceae bacterium]
MTKFLTLSLLLVAAISVDTKAQETQTLFSNDIDHGGFGAPVFGVTFVNGQATYLRGLRGAWVINFPGEHSVHIGLARYRTQSDFDATGWTISNISTPEMRTNYGGFELEYVNRSHRLFHYSIQTLVGSGNVRFRDRDLDLNRTSDSYFVLQPGVNLNLNITHWFRLSGGLFYRYAGGVNLEGTGDSELSGITSFVGLRFGKF